MHRGTPLRSSSADSAIQQERTTDNTPDKNPEQTSDLSPFNDISAANQNLIDFIVKQTNKSFEEKFELQQALHDKEIEDLKTTIENMKSTQKEEFHEQLELPKTPRIQDVKYQELLQTCEKNEKINNSRRGSIGPTSMLTFPNTQGELNSTFMATITELLKQNNKDTTTDIPKFNGNDSQWPKWYQLVRAYFKAKDWLSTFDHPIGPGTPDNPTEDFDHGINEKIYQKLQAKCFEGTAGTYVRMAAEFDGHGAGKFLRQRFRKKSP